MRYICYSFLIFITTIPLFTTAQSSSLIDNLDYVLFQKDIDSSRYDYSYWSYIKQDSFRISSRYKNVSETSKDLEVNRICDTIRWTKDVNLIPKLYEILKKQENIFLKEWDPVFDLVGGPVGLWEDQFNSLCIIDLTISYLEILKENWSPSKKYEFVKNLYMLIYGDYNKDRLKKTLFRSNYIKDKRNGYCSCNLLQKANYDQSLIDEFFIQDDRMIESMLLDINKLSDITITDDLQKFYRSALRNVFYKIPDDRIDSVLIENSDLLINLGFQDKVDHWDNDLPIKYYHLLLGRFRFASKNPRFIDILLDDIFNNSKSLKNLKRTVSILVRQNDSLIDYMIIERIVNKLLSIESENINEEIINLCNSTLSINDRIYMKYKLIRMTNENKITSDTFNRISEKLKLN